MGAASEAMCPPPRQRTAVSVQGEGAGPGAGEREEGKGKVGGAGDGTGDQGHRPAGSLLWGKQIRWRTRSGAAGSCQEPLRRPLACFGS